MPRPGNLRILFGAAFVSAVAVASGCRKPPVSVSEPGREKAGSASDPWDAVAKRVGKDTDPAAVRTALRQLSSDLAARPDPRSPAAMTPDALTAVAKLVPLSRAEAAEVAPAAYSGLDAVYVADALYLLDAARGLDPGGLPPADLARVGFDWVCRQVHLHPWVTETNSFVPAVPPTAVLRRGSGTGLERAYVFLALLQQLGIDGCLIGPPDAADKLAGSGGPTAGEIPRGPFWAVGARVGTDILLFDPWAGRAIPGPDGPGIATLAQVKTNPGLLKGVAGGPTADEVKAAAVFLAVPTNSLSPRMAALDNKLKADVGVKLATDPAAFQARFRDAAGGPPRFWHPDDPFAYDRVTATFTPVEDGGTDRSERRVRLSDQYLGSLLPREILVLPPGLEAPLAVDRLRDAGVGAYATAFLTPPGGQPGPRERIQRGQFRDATRFLTEKQDAFGRGLDRLREAGRDEIPRWVRTANELYANLRRAQYPDPLKDREPRLDADPGVADAKKTLDEFWRQTAPVVLQMVDRAVAGPGQAEAAYLLALAKHEEAERKQVRADRAGAAGGKDQDDARAAWAEAANAWDAFVARPVASRGLPARIAHATALAARAAALAGKK